MKKGHMIAADVNPRDVISIGKMALVPRVT